MSQSSPSGAPDGFERIEGAERAPALRPAAPVTFAQKKWVQDVLPWVTSGVFHLGLIIALVLVVKTVEQVVTKVQEQIIIPEATIIENAPVGGVVNPGLGADPNRAAAQDQITDSNRTEVRSQGQRLNQAVAGGTDGGSDSVLGIGANQGFSRGKSNGTGQGGGADQAGGIFGVPGGGGGGGPRVNFVGSSGNARRIVFLCDASGTMIPLFPSLQRQLRLSIDQLRPIQSFGIVFFNERVRTSSQSLVMGNPDNKRRAYDFVQQQTAGGPTLSVPAIQAAFAMSPELIFVLTDGFDQGNPNDVLNQFRRLNPDKRVKVNTIRIRGENETAEKRSDLSGVGGLISLLKTIAEESGGTYREVDSDDF